MPRTTPERRYIASRAIADAQELIGSAAVANIDAEIEEELIADYRRNGSMEGWRQKVRDDLIAGGLL